MKLLAEYISYLPYYSDERWSMLWIYVYEDDSGVVYCEQYEQEESGTEPRFRGSYSSNVLSDLEKYWNYFAVYRTEYYYDYVMKRSI